MMKFVTWVISAVAVVIAACIALAGYWLLAPYEVLTPTPATTRHVLTPVVHPGELVLYVAPLGFCKRLDVQGTLSRSFVDGIVYETTPVAEIMKVGECRNERSPSSMRIPLTLPTIPGGLPYHINGEASFPVNPLRLVVYPFVTEDFIVVPR